MVDIPTLSTLIKEPGLCARSSHAAPEPAPASGQARLTGSKSWEQLTLATYSVLDLFISATDGS